MPGCETTINLIGGPKMDNFNKFELSINGAENIGSIIRISVS